MFTELTKQHRSNENIFVCVLWIMQLQHRVTVTGSQHVALRGAWGRYRVKAALRVGAGRGGVCCPPVLCTPPHSSPSLPVQLPTVQSRFGLLQGLHSPSPPLWRLGCSKTLPPPEGALPPWSSCPQWRWPGRRSLRGGGSSAWRGRWTSRAGPAGTGEKQGRREEQIYQHFTKERRVKGGAEEQTQEATRPERAWGKYLIFQHHNNSSAEFQSSKLGF